MGDLSHIGSLGFTTKYVTAGNVKGLQANPVAQYTLNSAFGQDKKHAAFLGAKTELGLYINDYTENIVRFNHGTELFAGVDFSLYKSSVLKFGTKLQVNGGYHLFNGQADKQFGVTEAIQNSYYLQHKEIGANFDLNYKHKNYGNYSEKMVMNSGRNYAGAGLNFSFKPEDTNIELLAGSNVEFPIKKDFKPNEIEGEVSIGIRVNF